MDWLLHYIMSAMASQITSVSIFLLNRLFRLRSKKTLKLRVTGLCEGNSPVNGEFPAQRASNSENASVWWRHHATVLPRDNRKVPIAQDNTRTRIHHLPFSHMSPYKPTGHWQPNLPAMLRHTPSWRHGSLAHSLISETDTPNLSPPGQNGRH